MRNPKFKAIKPNYKKNVLEIVLREGGKTSKYSLPFGVFRDHRISIANKFSEINIDSELRGHGASFILEDGSRGDFPADLVLYYCDPAYDWSPVNQLKKSLKDKLKASKLSIRVIADALNTSPAQVMRLLEENNVSKQLMQLFQLAELAGYHIEFQLKKKTAA
ncbi:MAG: hypothetical protein AB1540_04830 [Bdellovibrionota bacterium]